MKFDCIIVLANEMDKVGNLNLESVSRIKLACDSYFNNPSTTLITCGWNYRKDSKLFIGDVMKNYAVKLGVPSEKIITEINSRDTVGDAFFTKLNILKNKEWKNILVTTSDYHVDRTSTIFKFIYGTEYAIKVIGSSGFDSLERQISEKKSLEAFKLTFQNIIEGDEIKIYERLSTLHPFYNGVVYSKINSNFKIKMENKILFLGPSDSPVFVWLQKNCENILSTVDKITVDYIIENDFNFLISYGYRFILRKEILDLFPNRAINMHISFLPYNRGADPNFWSLIERTPKGVSIHYLDEGVDTGDIIVQKEVSFDSFDTETLASSYQKLQVEIQNLFFQHWDLIKNQKCDRTPQVGTGTAHRVKEKEHLLHLMEKDGWNTKLSVLDDYSKDLKK